MFKLMIQHGNRCHSGQCFSAGCTHNPRFMTGCCTGRSLFFYFFNSFVIIDGISAKVRLSQQGRLNKGQYVRPTRHFQYNIQICFIAQTVFINLRNRSRQSDTGAILDKQRIKTDRLYSFWNNKVFQRSIVETSPPKNFQMCRERNARQLWVVLEGILSQRSNGIRKRNGSQIKKTGKSSISYGRNSVADNNTPDPCIVFPGTFGGQAPVRHRAGSLNNQRSVTIQRPCHMIIK